MLDTQKALNICEMNEWENSGEFLLVKVLKLFFNLTKNQIQKEYGGYIHARQRYRRLLTPFTVLPLYLYTHFTSHYFNLVYKWSLTVVFKSSSIV